MLKDYPVNRIQTRAEFVMLYSWWFADISPLDVSNSGKLIENLGLIKLGHTLACFSWLDHPPGEILTLGDSPRISIFV